MSCLVRSLCLVLALAPWVSAQEGIQLPDGLADADWVGVLEAHERGAHVVRASGDGYRARTPRQDWAVHFDGRGFLVEPDHGAWTWGLELMSYGYEGLQTEVSTPDHTDAEGTGVAYRWDDTLREWFVNDTRGLEHGFTLDHRAPSTPGGAPGPLLLTLAVRGPLVADVLEGGRDVRFVDSTGVTALSYSGLTVFDAEGAHLDARLESIDGALRLLVDDRGATYPLTIDPVAQQVYIKASNTGTDDRFGYTIAVSGNTLVVGAPWEDSSSSGVNGNPFDNGSVDSGAAYVFVRAGTTWSQQAYLKASNAEAGDFFGLSVTLSGNTIVVSAGGEDSAATGVGGDQANNLAPGAGAAYVFVRSGTTWTQQAYLKASNAEAGDGFANVALSGNTLVVGAGNEDSAATGVNGSQGNNSGTFAGAAYVFVRNGTDWSQQAYLKASNTESGDFFGGAVAISGDTVIVGAAVEDSNSTGVDGVQTDNSAQTSGAAYVFVRNGTTWSQQAYLKASNTDSGDRFGASVAISGNSIAIGAQEEASDATGVNGIQADNSELQSGAVYLFVRNGSEWSQQAYVKASNTDSTDNFYEVSLSEGRLVVGAAREDSAATGVNGDDTDNSAF